MAYATAADLEAFTGQAPTADDDRLLQRASDFIDAKLVGAFYDTDVNGNPTDPTLITAFNNACCAQVEYWRATNDELSQADRFDTVSVGSLTLTKGGRQSLQATPPSLAARAVDYLRVAGVWPVTPVMW